MSELRIDYEKYYEFNGDTEIIVCDYHSIEARLKEIQKGRFDLSYLSDDYHELLLMARDLSDDLDRAIDEFYNSFPQKSGINTGVYWFNSAITLYNGTNMEKLLENEGKYDKNEYLEKSIRLRAVNSLSKEQHFLLHTKTYELVFRYIKLTLDLDALRGINEELERLHSSTKNKDGKIELHKSAYV